MTCELSCDVLVIGAGVSGCCAAIQASRCGCRTILLEKDTVLGGNSGPNLGVEVRGAQWYNDYGQEVGLIHEIENEEARAHACTPVKGMKYNISRRREAVWLDFLRRAGVQVLKSHCAHTLRMEGSRILNVAALDTETCRNVSIHVSGSVVDASGDGTIATLAGAKFAMGVESMKPFGERSAPAHPNQMIQGSSLVAIACKTDHPIPFVPPDNPPPYSPRTWEDSPAHFYAEIKYGSAIFQDAQQFRSDVPDGTLAFLYVTEAGGDRDTVAESHQINEELLQQLWSFWHHVKNGPDAVDALQWDLLWVSPKTGKRESRRFVGDYILTQTDLEKGRTFDDDIAYGGHNLDDHRSYNNGHCSILTHSIPPIYGIPYRCCYAAGLDNLFLAGRLISATHIAHSSTRIMRTGGVIGQAVGMAAALCFQYGCSPQTLGGKYFTEFRFRLLQEDGSLPPRCTHFPGDLAPLAHISADAQLEFNEQTPEIAVPFFTPCGNMLYDWPKELHGVKLSLRNSGSSPISAVLVIAHYQPERRWQLHHEFSRYGRNRPEAADFHPLAEVPFTIPTGKTGWTELRLPQPLMLPAKIPMDNSDRLLIYINSSDCHLAWEMNCEKSEIAVAAQFDSQSNEWHTFEGTGSMRLDPPPLLGEVSQVTDGFNRRCGIAPLHMWMADFTGEKRTLRFQWQKSQKISAMDITFDNLEQTPDENPWRSNQSASSRLVSSYSVTAETKQGTITLFRIDDNYHRLCRHRFPVVETTCLDLNIEGIHNHGSRFGVYQVNIYDLV